jgi:hypothetical protein
MSIDEKDRFELIRYRLDEAKDTMEDVQSSTKRLIAGQRGIMIPMLSLKRR